MYSTFAENFNVLHETFGDDEDFFINNAIKFAVDRVASRMKVIAGVSDTVYDDVLRMTKEATAAKADAVMAVPPYYFGPTDDATLRYFSGIAKETDLPIVLYNFPARTGSDLSPELVARIAQEIPSVCGTKDTVDCTSHTRKVIQAVRKVLKDFAVLSGFDEVLRHQSSRRRQRCPVWLDQCRSGDVRGYASLFQSRRLYKGS